MTGFNFEKETAAEIAVLARDIGTLKPTRILLLDTCNRPVQELDRDLARALALRLLDLCDDLPEPARPIRRPTSVDEWLRDLDG
ncbi:hypothetical protein [Microbacterium sp. SORGH_AS_0888]|uniref:hypothetical protein n=1 Tax=Microbacterium sp. SORGH_AS_0888 TaxID=3041791 RepID=UPI00278645F1|nr:hypothetical protein [Microbacterium sp. SORGH_AS_0888]MDQ1130241.1 hypothetical protein [Microbacterium sp. SORGH_AS_0888]